MPSQKEPNEVVILGVKGSGKTVFLSILGHMFERVGAFGLCLRPVPRTQHFIDENYHLMAPDDGTPQEFPQSTDPNSNPLPLLWTVKVGTRPVFHMASLDCAGETMVRAFTEAGDDESDQRAGDALADMWRTLDAKSASVSADGSDALEGLDPVSRLRAMTKRASVVCLFLNPKDFEAQISALPGRYEERLARTLEKLGPGATESEKAKRREQNQRQLDAARKSLKDRFSSMRDLLTTFLDNEEFAGKRLVFVLTQTGDPALRAAIDEAGGPWGYLIQNVKELESYDLRGRAEAVAVSSVDNVIVVEDRDGTEYFRPDGPIESEGLIDFLLTVGGFCATDLAELKNAFVACRTAELDFVDAINGDLPLDDRFAAVSAWKDRADEWLAASEDFLGRQPARSISNEVRKHTQVFVKETVNRAYRRFVAEQELRQGLFELVAASVEEPREPTVEETLDRVNAAVELAGFEAFSAETLGLREDWWDETVRKRIEDFAALQAAFDEQCDRLDWRGAEKTLGRMELDAGEEFERRRTLVLDARRARAVRDCSNALREENEPGVHFALKALAEAEEAAGIEADPARPELEKQERILKVRLSARNEISLFGEALFPDDRKLRHLPSGEIRSRISAATPHLANAEQILGAAENEFGTDAFKAERDDIEKAKTLLAGDSGFLRRRASRRRRLVLLLLMVVAGAYLAVRETKKAEMEAIRNTAIGYARRAQYTEAHQILGRMPDWPILFLHRTDYADESLPKKWKELKQFGEAKSALDDMKGQIDGLRKVVEAKYGSDAKRLSGLSTKTWDEFVELTESIREDTPNPTIDEYGLPPEGEDVARDIKEFHRATARYERALPKFADATNRMARSVILFNDSRERAEKAIESLRDLRNSLVDQAGRRSLELKDWPQWGPFETSFADATNRMPVLRLDSHGLPVTEVPLPTLSARYRDLSGREIKWAQQRMEVLETAAKERFDRYDADTRFHRVQKEFTAKLSLGDWASAVDALDAKTSGALLDADDLVGAWNEIVAAGKPVGTFARRDWIEAKGLLDQLGGPAASEEEIAFLRHRKPLCEKAVEVFGEEDRRATFSELGREVEELLGAADVHWVAAAAKLSDRRDSARTAADTAAADAQWGRIKKGARAAVRAALNGKESLEKDFLVNVGFGSKILREEVKSELMAVLDDRIPKTAPEKVDWTRIEKDLATAENADGLSPARKSSDELGTRYQARAAGWSGQWLKAARNEAATAASKAKNSSGLSEAWTACRKAEALLEKVRDNPCEFDGDDNESATAEIEGSLPYLLCLSASKGDRRVDVTSVEWDDGIHKDGLADPGKKAGSADSGETAKVALLARNENQSAPIVTIHTPDGEKRKTVQFPKRGTNTLNIKL